MNEWRNKKIAVIGLGISNIPLIRFLLKNGAIISGRDRKGPDELGDRYAELCSLQIELTLGEGYLEDLGEYDFVFLTPGIPKHLPPIQRIKGKVPILSEIALVHRYAKAPIFGITGSSGKTTTTTLVGEMLKQSHIEVFVGGNIGVPLIEHIEAIPEDARIVLELSSFQLELMDRSPQGALVTNVTENHLDIHLTMDTYIAAKKQIYAHQHPGDVAVFNLDDPITAQMAKECPSEVYFFSTSQPVPKGAYLAGDRLLFSDGKGDLVHIVDCQEISLIGSHNLQNVLAAAILAHLAGASWEAIRHVIREFTGVPHRLEKVLTYQGVTYYNDSIATSPSRAIAGLRSFEQPIILIAGGYDKKLSFDQFATEALTKVKHLILLGQTAEQIRGAVERAKAQSSIGLVVHLVHDLQEAVECASSIAEKGDIVLLSPACASFDMYANFEERGAHFRKLVKNMGGSGDEKN